MTRFCQYEHCRAELVKRDYAAAKQSGILRHESEQRFRKRKFCGTRCSYAQRRTLYVRKVLKVIEQINKLPVRDRHLQKLASRLKVSAASARLLVSRLGFSLPAAGSPEHRAAVYVESVLKRRVQFVNPAVTGFGLLVDGHLKCAVSAPSGKYSKSTWWRFSYPNGADMAIFLPPGKAEPLWIEGEKRAPGYEYSGDVRRMIYVRPKNLSRRYEENSGCWNRGA